MIAGRTATRAMYGVIVEPRRPAATSRPGREDSADGPTRERSWVVCSSGTCGSTGSRVP